MTSDTRAGLSDEMAGSVHVIRLSPPGRGAVAVVLVDGANATELVAAFFTSRSGRPLDEIPLQRLALGRWGGPQGEELVVCRRTPHRIEVHPHGGEAAVENVVQRLVGLGAVECRWERWLESEEVSPLRWAARIALANAPTRRTAAILLDQFQGALERDLRLAFGHLERDASAARQILQRLSQRIEPGLHLVEPWRVVLAGRPNVGKSSLINALVGYERAIVYEQPGTTRDAVAARTAIEGWPVELSDTAGLRESRDPLEAEGIQLAERLLARADLVVWVLDGSLPSEELERQLQAARYPGCRIVLAINKVDLVGTRGRDRLRQLAGGCVELTSARTRERIDDLLSAIAVTLVPDPPAPGEAVPFNRQLADQIKAALASLDAGDLPRTLQVLQRLISRDWASW